MLEVGSIIGGKYKILNKVGGGDMSIVYRAEDEEHKQWAVKVFPKEGIRDKEAMTQSLVADSEILKKFTHPNLVKFTEILEDEEKFLIVMEYIQGKSIQQVLERKRTIEQEQVIIWAKQICDALEYLHAQTPAIIHKNVKPVNMMLKPDGSVMLIDFASVREFKDKSVETARWLATAGYAAPEQFGHEGEITAATDIYGLGATMYQMLTGENPCQPPYKIERPIRSFNSSLSEGLEKIVTKCTAENPEERYQTVAELRRDLEHYDEIDEIYKKLQKRRFKVIAACVAGGLIAVGAAIFGYYKINSKRGAEYQALLMKADTVEDYYDVILSEPKRADAYFQLNDFLVEDELLKWEEGKHLTKLRDGLESTNWLGNTVKVDVFDELRGKNYLEYQDVCYKIGESFAFFYEINSDTSRYEEARWWFAEASGKYVIANVYCEIADSLGAIAQYKQQDDMTKLGKEYEFLWEKLKSLLICAESFGYEDAYQKVQVWNEIVSIIHTNVEGIVMMEGPDEVQQLLNEIMNTSFYVNSEELRDDIEMLQNMIHEVKGSINKAGKNG